MINIEENRFKMTLPNGWVVSVVNHDYAYCGKPNGNGGTDTAEVWAWHSVTDEKFGDVRGYQSPTDIAAYILEVASLCN